VGVVVVGVVVVGVVVVGVVVVGVVVVGVVVVGVVVVGVVVAVAVAVVVVVGSIHASKSYRATQHSIHSQSSAVVCTLFQLMSSLCRSLLLTLFQFCGGRRFPTGFCFYCHMGYCCLN